MSPTRHARRASDSKDFDELHARDAVRSGQKRTGADRFRSSFVPHEERSSSAMAFLMLRGASWRWRDELPT